MFKLFKRLRAIDWLLIVVLCGFVVAQVYFDIELATYTQNIMEEMMKLSSTSVSILKIGGIMLLFAFGSMVCTIVVGCIAAYISSSLSCRLREELFKKVQSFSAAEIDKFSTPGLITRTTNDVNQVAMAVVMLLRVAVSAPVTAIWAIAKIQNTSLPLTFATAGWIIVMVLGIALIFIVVFPKFKIGQKLTDRLNGVTRENLTGLRVVRAYNAEDYQEEKFDEANAALTKTHLFVNRTMAFMGPGLMLIMNGITLTIYWLGAYLIKTGDGSFQFAHLAAFANLAMQVLSAFMMLTMLFIMIPRASVSANRINEVLDTELTILDREKCPISQENAGNIVFDHVYFKYPGADGYVLEDIDFTVSKGETLAVIGSTGSGKTTLVNLIPRLFDVTEGSVTVGGVNVKNAEQKQLRSLIGYVPQKGVLFSGSIEENICFGGNTDSQNMISAAQIASADGFINEKEDGYKSHISQGGKNVSGGQKQRLSIARAVAINPEILIFDDSFSALDYKTDRQVRSNLKNAAEDATKIIVAQRIGTIKDADQIIVLDKGRIVGKGKHEQLLNACEVYRKIALSQLSKEELGL